jgi:hypothetical protein
MKGPYERLKYDLRRLWECPQCKRRERTDGSVTFRFCECRTKQEGGRPVVMRLIADGPQRLVPVIAGNRECPDEAAAVDATPTRSVSEEMVPSEMASEVREHPDGPGPPTIASDGELSGG